MAGLPAELRDHPVYEVQRELGRGGMGVVYLARNKIMDRPEVLKVMHQRLAGRDEMARRFVKEIQLAARLHHPNIATAYAAFQAGDALMLAMEYVEGESLGEVVRREGPLPVPTACDYARQAALGLQRAHEEGLVHRDVTPHNLMVTRRGEIKVLDFGLAKATAEEPDGGLTGAGAMMGTPDYMPPEQARDARSADIRADIYSLGCTLFFLLTGRAPFAGRSPYELARAHEGQPPPAVDTLRPDVPVSLSRLVGRLLAKRPEDRPGTPREVSEALGRFCQRGDHPATVAPSETTMANPARPRAARRSWLLAAIAAAGLLGVVAAHWASGLLSKPAREPSEGPLSEKAAKGDEPAPQWPPATITNSLGMKLVLIPAGKFTMGSALVELRDDHEQQHPVRISEPFYLGAHEVTQAEYAKVMSNNPSCFRPGGIAAERVAGRSTSRFPVENVSYDDAVRFCERLSGLKTEKVAGRLYLLPTEAQWEYACRGGAAQYQTFHTGGNLTSTDANIDGYNRFERTGGSLHRPCEVGKYKPNPFGLYDMHGNVREWCRDWFDKDYYKVSPTIDPTGAPQGPGRVVRGGGWSDVATQCRSAWRSHCRPDDQVGNVGFRVLLIVPAKKD